MKIIDYSKSMGDENKYSILFNIEDDIHLFTKMGILIEVDEKDVEEIINDLSDMLKKYNEIK